MRDGHRPATQVKRSRYTPAQIRRNRLIALAIILVLIVLAVFAIRAIAGAFGKWQAEQAAEAKAYQIRMEQRTFPPPSPCPANAIKMELTHPSPVVDEGAGDIFHLALTNTGKTPCTMSADFKKIGVQIVSGNQIVYNSTACRKDETNSKQLLLGPNMTWKQDLLWDGRIQPADCSAPGEIAKTGTYRFLPLRDGFPGGEETAFVLRPAPQPSPSETSTETKKSKASPTGQPPKKTATPNP